MMMPLGQVLLASRSRLSLQRVDSLMDETLKIAHLFTYLIQFFCLSSLQFFVCRYMEGISQQEQYLFSGELISLHRVYSPIAGLGVTSLSGIIPF
jgi:hypothetical protein